MAYKYGNTINSRWRSYASYTISTTATQVKVTVSAGFQNVNSYNYRSYNCSGYITDGTDRYNGSSSDIGGNSGGVRDQLISSKTYTYNRTTSSYSKTITFSLTTTGGTLAPGTSKSSVSVPVPALAKYTISYNANGGTGTVTAQTKYYGKTVTIKSGSGLSRTNYTFVGWNTKADGTGTDYVGEYSTNANLTLYAKWKLVYIKPVIQSITAYRVADESSTTETETGTYVHLSFAYKGGSTDGGATQIPPICKITINGAIVRSDSELPNGSGTFTATYGTYSVNTTVNIKVQLHDETGTEMQTATRLAQVGSLTLPFDALGNRETGKAYVGIGGVAISGCDIALHGEDIRMSLNTNSGAGADYEIYSALQALGWVDLII